MSKRDPLWTRFPRWLEESRIPVELIEGNGPTAWIVYRKLIERDCDVNLSPDWFSCVMDDLARWTGLQETTLESTLVWLHEHRWVDIRDWETDVPQFKIMCPPPIDLNEGEIRVRIAGHTKGAGNFILRYFEETSSFEVTDRVVYLYQMMFGAKFSPRIAEDLQEIASTYGMSIINEVFEEAFNKNAKSLSWIKTHLRSRVGEDLDEKSRSQ